jgi:hypothetical protein
MEKIITKDILDKCVENLKNKGLYAYIEYERYVYVVVDDVHLAIAEFEIEYQADEFDDKI